MRQQGSDLETARGQLQGAISRHSKVHTRTKRRVSVGSSKKGAVNLDQRRQKNIHWLGLSHSDTRSAREKEQQNLLEELTRDIRFGVGGVLTAARGEPAVGGAVAENETPPGAEVAALSAKDGGDPSTWQGIDPELELLESSLDHSAGDPTVSSAAPSQTQSKTPATVDGASPTALPDASAVTTNAGADADADADLAAAAAAAAAAASGTASATGSTSVATAASPPIAPALASAARSDASPASPAHADIIVADVERGNGCPVAKHLTELDDDGEAVGSELLTALIEGESASPARSVRSAGSSTSFRSLSVSVEVKVANLHSAHSAPGRVVRPEPKARAQSYAGGHGVRQQQLSAEGAAAASALKELEQLQQQLLEQVSQMSIEDLELVQSRISRQRETLLEAVKRESARAMAAAAATPRNPQTPLSDGRWNSPPSPKGSYTSASSVLSSRSAFSAVRRSEGNGGNGTGAEDTDDTPTELRARTARGGWVMGPMQLSYGTRHQLEGLVAKQKRALLGDNSSRSGSGSSAVGGGGGRRAQKGGGRAQKAGRLGRSHLRRGGRRASALRPAARGHRRGGSGSGGTAALRDDDSDDELRDCIRDGAGQWDSMGGRHEGRHNPHASGLGGGGGRSGRGTRKSPAAASRKGGPNVTLLRLASDPPRGDVGQLRPKPQKPPTIAVTHLEAGLIGGGGRGDAISVTSEGSTFSSFSRLSSSFDHPHAFSPRASRGKSIERSVDLGCIRGAAAAGGGGGGGGADGGSPRSAFSAHQAGAP